MSNISFFAALEQMFAEHLHWLILTICKKCNKVFIFWSHHRLDNGDLYLKKCFVVYKDESLCLITGLIVVTKYHLYFFVVA